ncbi:MAG: tetratricopeptide repeat protein [Gammaproteobacteria bacterium]|nr:tetratricopeptide repeat protein [Gammaproteobacteria bacterium]
MDFETEEQQVEALKEWWAENGRAVIVGVVLGAGLIGGWTLWKNAAEKAALAASDTFSASLDVLDKEETDITALNSLAETVSDEQPKSLYASYTRLAAAREAVEAGDIEQAKEHLAWVVDNSKQEEVTLIAQIRLARVEGALGGAEAGLKLLPESYSESFTALIEEARGDLLVANGDASAALSAYQKAQDSGNVANPTALTMKINELASADESS